MDNPDKLVILHRQDTRQTKPKTIFHLFIEMVKSTSVSSEY